jgi:hypothetical protein
VLADPITLDTLDTATADVQRRFADVVRARTTA